MENHGTNRWALTLPMFLAVLEELVVVLKWTPFFLGDRRIRLRPPTGKECCCPITAVHYYKTKTFVKPRHARKLAMGLHPKARVKVINAADTKTMEPEIRLSIERALKLK